MRARSAWSSTRSTSGGTPRCCRRSPAQEHPAGGPNARQFAAVSSLADWNAVTPRLAVVFDVKGGRGTSTLFVIDTEQTQILGTGGFDLEHERFDTPNLGTARTAERYTEAMTKL